MLGAEVAGIGGRDAGKAGLELLARGVDLIEASEHLAVEVVGRAILRVVGDGGFEGGIGGVEEIGLVLVSGLEEERVAALGLGVGFVGGVGCDDFEC